MLSHVQLLWTAACQAFLSFTISQSLLKLMCIESVMPSNHLILYHFLLQCMKVKSESEVAQSCPTLSNRMDCSLPGSSIHGIFQARVLEWVAIAFSEVIADSLHANPWTAADQARLSYIISLSLFRFTSIWLMILSNHLILCHPFIILPSIFPRIRVFSNESVLHIWW